MLLALFEAGIEPPSALVGVSVGALNGACIAAYPSLGGASMLRQTWLSKLARDVFSAHPVGVLLARLRRGNRLAALPDRNVRRLIERQLEMVGMTNFEQLTVPLAVIATDIGAGKPALFQRGPMAPALRASTAIPGVFPPVLVDGIEYLDGGIVDNTPLDFAVQSGAKDVLAVSLMAGGEYERGMQGWGSLIARTLQLSLHHRMLSDYERLRGRGRVVVLCPVLAPTVGWDMRPSFVEAIIEGTRAATLRLLAARGPRLFRRSGVHYLKPDLPPD